MSNLICLFPCFVVNNDFPSKNPSVWTFLPLTVGVLVCREDEDPEYKPLRMPFKDDLDDFTNSPLDEKDEAMEVETEGAEASQPLCPPPLPLTVPPQPVCPPFQLKQMKTAKPPLALPPVPAGVSIGQELLR